MKLGALLGLSASEVTDSVSRVQVMSPRKVANEAS